LGEGWFVWRELKKEIVDVIREKSDDEKEENVEEE
jgi:hypothetical protein